MYWQIEYDIDWLPICEICGKSFKKLLTHIVQKHNISAKEYKINQWLDINKWICCNETKLLLQKRIKENYDIVVIDNLINKWKQTRFIKWNSLWKKYTSEQTKQRLKTKHLNIWIKNN